jgi:Uma2 family endonuclease
MVDQSYQVSKGLTVDGHARYPDALVACQPVPPTATIVDNPGVVVDVVGEGSTSTDLIDKIREYCATPSIQCHAVDPMKDKPLVLR